MQNHKYKSNQSVQNTSTETATEKNAPYATEGVLSSINLSLYHQVYGSM